MAEKKYVQTSIVIPKSYGPTERRAIAIEILDYIRDRTNSGLDKREQSFPKYSKEYKNSFEFKVAGKSGKVDLKLSGDMLAVMDLIKTSPGKIVIGFDPGSSEAERAEGNIRGSYGKSRGDKSKARDFLGIDSSVLKAKILSKFPLSDKSKSESFAKKITDAEDFSEDLDSE